MINLIILIFILKPVNNILITTTTTTKISSIMSGLNVEKQTLSSENLANIQWSETSIPLCDFVTKYPLPQIVQIEEGYHGGSDENSLSMGQVLKIHTLTTERKLRCQDRHGKELQVPVHTQNIYLKPENHDTVFQRVQDLSHAKPLPKFVEVTRGYYDVDSDVDYELSVDPGEILEVVEVNESNIFTKKTRSMTFRNHEGIVLKIPFDCVAGFKPLVDNTPHVLSDVIPNMTNNYKFPFYFQFHGVAESNKVGIVKATAIYDDHLIIASCGHGQSQVVFMIPQNLKVKVKLAVGTLKEDPEYETIKRSYHNFKSLETDLKKSQSFRGRMMTTSESEIVGFPMHKAGNQPHLDWVTFDQDSEQEEVPNPFADINNRTRAQSVPNGLSSNDNTPYDGLSMRKKLSVCAITSPHMLNGASGNEHIDGQQNPNTMMHPHNPQQQYQPQQQQNGFNRQQGQINGPSHGQVLMINRNGNHTPSPSYRRQSQEVNLIPGMSRDNSPSISRGNSIQEDVVSVDKYKEIREMSVQQLADCLKTTLNMGKHVEAFLENQVDGELFLHLNDEELTDLNLNKFEIKKLYRFKDGWRPKVE